MAQRWVVVVLMLTCGCALSRAGSLHMPPDQDEALVWPAPPERPRIRFVQELTGPDDLGWRAGFWHGVVGWLAGSSSQERFVRPTGVAAAEGMLWVADPGAQSLWMFDRQRRRARRIQRAGTTLLVSPVAVAIGPHRSAFLVDSSLAVVIAYDAAGRMRHTIAAPGFLRPSGVAYDLSRDRLYVADSGAHVIWVLTGQGEVRGALGRRGAEPGEFNFPTHLALDPSGGLSVTDALGFRIQRFTPAGAFAGQFGRHGDASGDLASPKGLAVDGDGRVYVVDALFDTVQIFDASGRLLLNFGQRGSDRGAFWLPNGLCLEDGARIYVADAYNQRVQVFELLDADQSAPR